MHSSPSPLTCIVLAGALLTLAPGCGEHAIVGAGAAKSLPLRSAPVQRLMTTATVRGPNDPHDFDLSLLLPRHARTRQIWFLHGGRQSDQVLVEWVRSATVSLYGANFSDDVEWGLSLWTQTPQRPLDYAAPWRSVAIPVITVAPGAPFLRVALADVTSDRHPDVLIEQYPHTNHNCGPHEVVATRADGTSWRIFRADLCETPLGSADGLLALDRPYYGPGEGVCCWSRVERVRLRWNGQKYVIVSDRIVGR